MAENTHQGEYTALRHPSKPNNQKKKAYTTPIARQNKVKHLVIGNEYYSIASKACMNITKIHRLELSASVTSVGEGAFRGCTQLTSVNLPCTLRDIGEAAFMECRKLREINLPKGLKIIRPRTFKL